MSSEPTWNELSAVAANSAPGGAYELVLELARAEDSGDPFGFRFAEQTYLLRQQGGAYASAVFSWSPAVLDDLSALQKTRPDPMARQRLGERLREFLEQAGWGVLESELEEALAAGRPVHLTVRSSAAEMYALPWELLTLRGTGQHLGELPGCLLRYEWPGTETAAAAADDGRILVAWSAAGGPVPAAAHVAAVRRACEQGHHPFADRDVLAHVSLRRLRAELEAGPVAVLHILCHGAALDARGQGYGLVWNASDREEGREIIDAGALRRLLAPHAGSLRLVVLSACQGGSAGAPGNHLGSVAQALHRVGIPAVVASRAPLSVQGSIALSNILYERLLVGLESLEEAFLAARQRLATASARLDWAALQLYARRGDGAEHRPVVFRPYQGLEAFTAEERRFFFGRDAEVDKLVGVLRRGQRLLVLAGASGVGKSSLVLAGLVPRVQEGALGPEPVEVRVMHPGARPGRALAGALAGRSPGTRLLLVVEQFEELFTQAQDPAEVADFVSWLLDVTSSPATSSAHSLTVVITLRADFLGKCLELDYRMAARLATSMQIVLPMREEQLRTAIVAPAARVGLHVEHAVVEALLDQLRVVPAEESVGQLGAGAGNLPLLGFALEALWERREGNRITWAAWEAIGSLRGAIAQRADAVLAGCATARRRRLVRDLFCRLVQLGRGTEDTRRYVLLSEIESIAPGEAGQELQRWIDARLLAVDEDEVWVAHEAVIREWGTLRRWLDEEREALLVQQDLALAMQRWEAEAYSVDELWRGDRLQQARLLHGAGQLRLSTAEARFLHASEAARRAAVEAAAARHRREQTLARKARERKRLLILGTVLLVVVAGALLWWPHAEQPEAAVQPCEPAVQP